MRYYETIVNKRNSCRDFDEKAEIEATKVEEVLAYYNDEESVLVEGIETELKFYDGDIFETLGNCVGYNGYCIKSPGYMVLFSEEKPHYIENSGFIAQGITLKLTELGLAACWQTINDHDMLSDALRATGGKVATCVISFGYINPSSTAKKAPKKSYKEIAYTDKFGQALDTSRLYPELEDCLRAVSHAQSFANRQPYCVIVTDDYAYLVGLPDLDTNKADELLNYGIVMFNFYAVMSATRAKAPKWKFDAPDVELKLPAGATYVAKIRI